MYLRNLQEQVKNAFSYQKLFWSFTVWINCSSYLKIFANSQPSASNFKGFPWSLRPEICEKYFLSFPQKIYKLRQLSLSQFVYFLGWSVFTFQFLNDKIHNYVEKTGPRTLFFHSRSEQFWYQNTISQWGQNLKRFLACFLLF